MFKDNPDIILDDKREDEKKDKPELITPAQDKEQLEQKISNIAMMLEKQMGIKKEEEKSVEA